MKNIAVIGGGLSGISMAYFLDRLASAKNKKISIDIIEKHSEFAKDKIGKFQFNQDIYDSGWHNSIRENGMLFHMMQELGLDKYLIKSKDTYKVMQTDKGLKSLPNNMLYAYPLDIMEVLYNEILSPSDKLSLFLNINKNKKIKDISKITIEDFFKKKVSSKIYSKLIEPLLTSHYGSDISKQSLSYLMPELAFATLKNSNVKEVLKTMSKASIKDGIVNAKEFRLRFTLRSFLESLESYFSNRVFTGFDSNIEKVEKVGNKYRIVIDGKKYYYDYVIISVKHTEFLPWFNEDEKLKEYYKPIKFVSNIVANIIVKKNDLQLNPEIGEIIFPKEEGKCISNLEYTSNKWIDIKSKDIHLMRAYINRQEAVNKLINLPYEDIAQEIIKELESLHGKVEIQEIHITKVPNNYVYADNNYSKYIYKISEYVSKKYDKMYFIGNSKKAINLETTLLEARETARDLIEKI